MDVDQVRSKVVNYKKISLNFKLISVRRFYNFHYEIAQNERHHVDGNTDYSKNHLAFISDGKLC